MKKIELLFVATIVMFFAAACSDDDPVTPPDNTITMTKAGGYYYGPLEESHTAANVELWLGTSGINQNNFTVGGNGTALLLQMYVTDNEAGTIPAGTYKAAALTSSPAANTFATGTTNDGDISQIYLKEDDSAAKLLNITDGTVTIAVEGSTYTVTGTVKADGNDYTFKYTGLIIVSDEREPEYFTFPRAAAIHFGEMMREGFDNFTLYFMTEDIVDWGTVFDGTGTVLMFDIYEPLTGNGYIAPGNYSAYTNDDGNYAYKFTPGFYFEDWGTDAGSLIDVYQNDVNVNTTYISDGEVIITKNGENYTVKANLMGEDGEEYFYKYEGEITNPFAGYMTAPHKITIP